MGNCLFLRRGAPPSSGPQLGDLEPGTLISLEENGAQVPDNRADPRLSGSGTDTSNKRKGLSYIQLGYKRR